MDPKNQYDKKLRDALLTSIQQLCRIFWGPTEEFCQQMLEPSFLQPFDAIASRMESRWAADLSDLQNLLEGFSEPTSLFAYLEQGYIRLFVNARGGIAAPLYASCYEGEENPHLMGDAAVRMRKTLLDLGISISADVGEPPDHLSIELEVLYYLLTQDSGPDPRVSIKRASDFVAECMIPWVKAFYLRLADEVHCRFYPLITAVLLGVLHEVSTLSF
ncbi:MAG: molecular chaperone TorD family protein [Desulfobacteraceae bacterium]|jgi:TorA maturation chaperone TorD